jgi:CheY-like chemotaxis protein
MIDSTAAPLPHTFAPGPCPPDTLTRTGAAGLSRILVVDDEDAIRCALARFLEKRGYDVEVCESGPAALGLLGHESFVVMICDIRMPGMSGLDVVPRALELDRDLAVLMLTGVNDARAATVRWTIS